MKRPTDLDRRYWLDRFTLEEIRRGRGDLARRVVPLSQSDVVTIETQRLPASENFTVAVPRLTVQVWLKFPGEHSRCAITWRGTALWRCTLIAFSAACMEHHSAYRSLPEWKSPLRHVRGSSFSITLGQLANPVELTQYAPTSARRPSW